MTKSGYLCLVVIFGFLLNACQSSAAADTSALTMIEAADAILITPTTDSNTLSSYNNDWQHLETEEPLKFTFPTPSDPPVSLWRPPLYEVPWALSPHDHFYFIRPIAADEVNWPLADYRYGYYFTGTTIVHTGIDIDAKRGTPVIAAADGTVVWAGIGLYKGPDSPG